MPWLLEVILYVLQSQLLSCVFFFGGGVILCSNMLIIIQSIGFIIVLLFDLTEKISCHFFFLINKKIVSGKKTFIRHYKKKI
jgi:hypothetical protein